MAETTGLGSGPCDSPSSCQLPVCKTRTEGDNFNCMFHTKEPGAECWEGQRAFFILGGGVGRMVI